MLRVLALSVLLLQLSVATSLAINENPNKEDVEEILNSVGDSQPGERLREGGGGGSPFSGKLPLDLPASDDLPKGRDLIFKPDGTVNIDESLGAPLQDCGKRVPPCGPVDPKK